MTHLDQPAMPEDGPETYAPALIYMVAPEEAGMRLDRFVVTIAPTLSRTRAQELIAAGGVLVNRRAVKAGTSLAPSDTVELIAPIAAPPAPDAPQPEAIPLMVVFEDAHLLVIDKPAGMVVHPAPGHPGGTLVNALLGYTANLGNATTARPGIVHRLDRDTSGLLLVAKDDPTHEALGRMMHDRTITKEYLALIEGIVDPPAALIDAPIGRDPRHRQQMAVLTQRGRDSQTRYITERVIGGRTLVRATLITGRTHQIRVHFAAIHHPVVGDLVYGRTQSPMPPRQFLHAAHLAFRHPITQIPMDIVSPLPPDLEAFLAKLDNA